MQEENSPTADDVLSPCDLNADRSGSRVIQSMVMKRYA
jgi:hypothetical protein